jgi:hypothetical protein
MDEFIVQPLTDVTTVDMVTPVIYAPIYPRGEKGDPGRDGMQGPREHTDPAGKDAPIIPSMSSIIFSRDAQLEFYPVIFYFPISAGSFEPQFNITNATNINLVQRDGPFSIRFNLKAFVNVDVKLLIQDNKHVLLIKGYEKMVDNDQGPCINMKWIGIVDIGTTFILGGDIDIHTNGYWYVSIL